MRKGYSFSHSYVIVFHSLYAVYESMNINKWSNKSQNAREALEEVSWLEGRLVSERSVLPVHKFRLFGFKGQCYKYMEDIPRAYEMFTKAELILKEVDECDQMVQARLFSHMA